MTDAPLAGIKVLDLTRLLPGPVCTLHLADLGAEVIKIENPGAGDYARTMGPGAAPGEDSFFFRVVNRNKRGMRLDLRQPAGVAVFLRLARGAEGARTRSELERLFATRPLAHWTALFDTVDCGVTPVLSFEEAMANPQIKARGMLAEIDGLKQFAPPFKMSGLEFVVRRPAPKVGSHSTAILREAGYSEAEIGQLQSQGVI